MSSMLGKKSFGSKMATIQGNIVAPVWAPLQVVVSMSKLMDAQALASVQALQFNVGPLQSLSIQVNIGPLESCFPVSIQALQ